MKEVNRMILHGVYDNGNITIEEKNLPDVTAKVEILFPDISDVKNDYKLGSYRLGGIYDNVNVREAAYDEK